MKTVFTWVLFITLETSYAKCIGVNEQLSSPTREPQSATISHSDPTTATSSRCTQENPCAAKLTWYETATSAQNPSYCGSVNDGSEHVVAISKDIMTPTDCERLISVSYGGKSSIGKVVDKCMGCDGTRHLDLSRGIFSALGGNDGVLEGATWYFV